MEIRILNRFIKGEKDGHKYHFYHCRIRYVLNSRTDLVISLRLPSERYPRDELLDVQYLLRGIYCSRLRLFSSAYRPTSRTPPYRYSCSRIHNRWTWIANIPDTSLSLLDFPLHNSDQRSLHSSRRLSQTKHKIERRFSNSKKSYGKSWHQKRGSKSNKGTGYLIDEGRHPFTGIAYTARSALK